MMSNGDFTGDLCNLGPHSDGYVEMLVYQPHEYFRYKYHKT
jgi:hypothetical protein